jgi:uncharacterized membrane protein YtjA (UPF0391 family)
LGITFVNLLKLAMMFLAVAILGAALGFALSWGAVVTHVARFFFFLCSALFIVFGLTHLFMGEPENRGLGAAGSPGNRQVG